MSGYLLFKSLHLIAVISWMAGLLYLPRIFVYHVENYEKEQSVKAIALIRAYRIRGHLIANLDPLSIQKKEEQLVPSNSFVFLIDLKGINMSHTTKYLINFIKKALQILPLRNEDKLFRCIILNPPTIFKFIFSICSPFIDKETKEKIIIISNRKKDKNRQIDVIKYCEEEENKLHQNKKL